MALSQIQCLDDNHVNPRTHESKPEFLYSEEQRSALETLLRDGREAFFKHLEARGLRGFLSELELESLAGAVETFDPGSDLYQEDAEDEQTPLSLHYWPDMSDMSIPQLDLGWPDSEAYRGVTRTTVHTQPPLDGQAHIKEVIRKMIAQAQKVIAVVMDVFTDVDIFRDLLDASFKRKVSVYILLERTSIPHFLSMCQRANMHTGHLKNLRVRCSEGTEFYTHSCTKVKGRMGHKFMFIDGDKAVSGSYSFTWMSSRLDRNLITVVTGQAVDAFDRLFRFLYTTSRLVDLRRVATEPEPEPDPVPQPTSVAPPSATVARKLYNPKYALVAAGNTSLSPSSSGNNSPKESQKDTKKEESKRGRRRPSKEVVHEAPPLHPGLVNLEKAYLFDYLPTWPEPDPPKDVIGFINIRDTSKPTQVHLQRSEMFETSQAIRFSSPISMQKEILPEVAKPRTLTAPKYEENLSQPQEKTPLEAITVKTKPLPQSKSDKENAKSPNVSPANNNTLHSSPTKVKLQTPQETLKIVTTPPASANSPNTMNTESSLNSKSTLQNRTESNQSSKPLVQSDSNVPTIQKHSSLGNISSSPDFILGSVTTTSASANYQESEATVRSSLTSTGTILPLTTICTLVSKPNTYSHVTASSTPPVPKPRTVQLVIKDSSGSGHILPEVSIVKKPDCTTKVTTVHNEPLVATVLLQKEPDTDPKLTNKSASKSIPEKSKENTGKDCSQQKQSATSQEVSREEAAGPHNDKSEAQLVACNKIIAQSNSLVTKPQKDEDKKNLKAIPKEDEALVKGTGDLLNNKPLEILPRSSGIAKVPSQTSNKIGRSYCARVNVPQRISYSNSEEDTDSLKTPNDKSPKLKTHHKADSTPTLTVDTQQGEILPHVNESVLRTATFNTHTPLLSPRVAPEKPACLYLSDSKITDLPTPDKESRALLAQRNSPIPDGVLPPESRMCTPDFRTHTPDLRTPTSDISDGYGSTTSDEYYECNESPFHESIDRVPFYSLGAKEDKCVTAANSCGAFIDQTMLNNDRMTSSSETLNLSTKGSLSSILEKLSEEEKAIDERNRKEQEDQEKKREQDSRRLESRKDTGRLDLQTTLQTDLQVDKPPTLKCNKVLSEAAVTELSLTPHNEATETKRMPVRELKPKRVFSRAERADKMPAGGEKTVDRAALSAGSMEGRDTPPPATKEPEGQKQQQQKDSGGPSQSRLAQPSRPPRPLSATQSTVARPWGNQIERKMSDSDLQVLDSSSSSRRLPPRPSLPAAAPKVSQNKHPRQPAAAQAKPKPSQTQQTLSPLPKPQSSFLYTHKQQPRVSSQHQNQTVAMQEGPGLEEEEKTAFGITFSKLYNLKGLKDKMSKLPTQSRSGSSSSAQPRKSTG